MRLVNVGWFLLACVATVGCGGSNDSQPPPQTPPPQPPPPYYGQPPYNPNAPPPGAMGPAPSGPMTSPPPAGTFGPAPGAPPPTTGAPPPVAGGPAPAGSVPFPTIPGLPPFPTAGGSGQSSGPSAQPIDPNLAAPATALLNIVAASDAPGMQREGAPLAGNFQEGQVLEAPVTIQPGKCYTIVAAGVGPQELELSLVPQSAIPGLPSVGSLGSARGSAQKTVLGGGGNCIKLALIPVPVNAKFVLKVTRGAGLAAGQVFVK